MKMSDTINESEDALAIRRQIEEARAEYQKANDKFNRRYQVLKAKYDVEMARVPMTLEDALHARLPEGDNTRGYEFLKDLTWKGDWKDYGLKMMGCHWATTNQHCLTIFLAPSEYGEVPKDYIEGTATRIEAVLPLVKGDQLVKNASTLGLSAKYQGYTVFETQGYDSEREHLVVLTDRKGLWGVVDVRSDYSRDIIWEIPLRPLRDLLISMGTRKSQLMEDEDACDDY
jgi:hypothetical protein